MNTRRRRFLVVILVGALLAITDATRAADNMVFVPLAPCRVIDTRVVGAGGPLVAGAPRTFFFRGPTRNYATSPTREAAPPAVGSRTSPRMAGTRRTSPRR